MLPLFGAVPGGPELLVILLVLLVLFGPVVVLVVLAMRHLGDDAEVAELERRIDRLEAKVEDGGDRETDRGSSFADGEPSGTDPESDDRD